MTKRFLEALLLALLTLGASPAFATWSLDPAFGAQGVATTIVPGGDALVHSLVEQPDGRILAAGEGGPTGTLLVRYLPSGALDASFGNGGWVAGPAASSGFVQVALQPDGRIVALSSMYTGGTRVVVVSRFLADGTLDASFGTGGSAVIGDPAQSLSGAALALLPDGKILVAGGSAPNFVDPYMLLRLNADGARDATFGINGRVDIPVDIGVSTYITGMAVQPDGRILVAGSVGNLVPAVFRFLQDGAPDPTFGVAGRASPPPPLGSTFALVRSVWLRDDGRFLLAGSPSVQVLAVSQMLGNGTADVSFGAAGVATSTPTYAFGVCTQPDGSVVVAGSRAEPPAPVTYDMVVARFTPTGAPDPAFFAGGVLRRAIVGEEEATAVLCQRDGGIIAAGYTAPSDGSVPRRFTLLRVADAAPVAAAPIPALSSAGLVAVVAALLLTGLALVGVRRCA